MEDVRIVRDEFSKCVDDHPGGGECLTKQSFREETDLNSIMDRFIKTGMPPVFNVPQYADVSGYPKDLQEAFERVHDARMAFNALPAEVRALAENDPVKMAYLSSTVEGREQIRQVLEAKKPFAERSPASPAAVANPPAPAAPATPAAPPAPLAAPGGGVPA